MKFETHATDLHCLPEHESETKVITEFCRDINWSKPIRQFSDVPGQDWYGKFFYDIPFGAHLQPRIEATIKEKSKNKYNYIKVIQGYYAGYWEDCSEYDRDDKTIYQDIKEYRLTGYPHRIINRRVPNPYYQGDKDE